MGRKSETARRPARAGEKGFMGAVIQAARAFGYLVYHTHDSRKSEEGFPDLVLCHRKTGRLVFAELKAEGEEPTLAQEDWLAALRRDPASVALVRCWRPSDWHEIERVLKGEE